jgi:hypothetical protein
MALSEHEQRVLDELERGLYADDEQLARRLKKVADETPLRKQQRSAARRIAGAAVVIAGLGVLFIGLVIHYSWMGIAGFALTLVGLVFATSPVKGVEGEAKATKPKRKSSPAVKPGSINDFFEERWNRRMNGE